MSVQNDILKQASLRLTIFCSEFNSSKEKFISLKTIPLYRCYKLIFLLYVHHIIRYKLHKNPVGAIKRLLMRGYWRPRVRIYLNLYWKSKMHDMTCTGILRLLLFGKTYINIDVTGLYCVSPLCIEHRDRNRVLTTSAWFGWMLGTWRRGLLYRKHVL